MKKIILTSLICGLAGTLSAQNTGYSIDFNGGATDLSGNFNKPYDQGPLSDYVTWGETAGVGGSGGLTVTDNTAGTIYYKDTFNVSSIGVGQTISSSIDFLWSNTSATSQTLVTMGFTTENAKTSVSSREQANTLGASIIRNNSDTVTLRLRLKNTNYETLNFDQSELNAGEWYQLSFTLVKTETSGVFDYAVDLFSIGEDGIGESAFKSISGQVTNTAIYDSESAFYGYDIRSGGGTGITHIDNMTVTAIPEPATYVLFAGVAGLFAAMMYKRRK